MNTDPEGTPFGDLPPPPGEGAGAPPPPPPPGGGPPGYGVRGAAIGHPAYTALSLKTRDSVVEWLLCCFVPFYALVWIHRASKELQASSGGQIDYESGATLPALTFGWLIIVPPFVSWSSFVGRIRTAQLMVGFEPRVSFWGSIGRMLLFGYGFKWLQDQLNELAVGRQAHSPVSATTPKSTTVAPDARLSRVTRTLAFGFLAGGALGAASAAFELGDAVAFGLGVAALLVVGLIGFHNVHPVKMPWEERGPLGGIFSDR